MDTTWDIFFFSNSIVDTEVILSFFKEQPNFHIRPDRAEYFNKLTKTEFVFEFHNKHEQDELIPLSMTLDLLMMNSAHAHEAGKITSRLCAAMNLKIFFPYTMSTHGEDFPTKRFLERWARNKDKIKDAYLKYQIHHAHSKQILEAWKWNYNIPWTKKFLNDKVETPKIQFASFSGHVATFIYFDPKTTTSLPLVDYYVILKNKSKGLFKQQNAQKFIIPQDALKETLSQMRFMPFDDAPFYKYQPQVMSTEVNICLKESKDLVIQVIDIENIVDQELVNDDELLFEDSIY